MSNAMMNEQNDRYLSLYEELEVRYGAVLAQEIADQVKKTDDMAAKQARETDYMTVKALSEVVEDFRGQAQEIVKKLKVLADSKVLPVEVVSLEQKRLKNDLAHMFDCYWLAQQSFYRAYNRALKIYEAPAPYKYDRFSNPTKMAA